MAAISFMVVVKCDKYSAIYTTRLSLSGKSEVSKSWPNALVLLHNQPRRRCLREAIFFDVYLHQVMYAKHTSPPEKLGVASFNYMPNE